ncbi:MAG TPA: anti-sigma factor [Beijerinckiaceae bacterium]|jgi:anti-sigma-K factor RskA
MSEDEREIRAGEYALGTLRGAERAAFERLLAGDPALREKVRLWAERLAPLGAGIAPVVPPPELWSRVEAAIAAPPASAVLPFPDRMGLEALRRSRARWRAGAIGAGSLAAALALAFGLERFLAPPAAQGTFIAAVNRGGDLPALLIRVDPRSGTVQVRPVAAETPQGHSLELWSVAAGAAPRSLGTLDDPAARHSLPQGVSPDGLTLAVSVEPKGGSPTGAPTGPVVYSGRLVREP